MTYLVRLVHDIEDRHIVRTGRGKNPLKAYKPSVLGATPEELRELHTAVYNLPDGSGRRDCLLNHPAHYRKRAVKA